MKSMLSFESRLKEERNRLGLDQHDFANSCGVKRMAQSNYETGKRSPDAKYLAKAAELGVNINYVLTGEMIGRVTIQTNVPEDSPFFQTENLDHTTLNETPNRDFNFYMQQIQTLKGHTLPDNDLAIILGANRNTFSSWKRNNRVPYKELVNFCQDFGYNMHWFFFGQGEVLFDVSDTSAQIMQQPAEISTVHKGDLVRAVRVISTVLGNKWGQIDETAKAELIIKTYDYFQCFNEEQQSTDEVMGKIMKEVIKVIS